MTWRQGLEEDATNLLLTTDLQDGGGEGKGGQEDELTTGCVYEKKFNSEQQAG